GCASSASREEVVKSRRKRAAAPLIINLYALFITQVPFPLLPQSLLLQPLFEERNAVVSPEHLAIDNENWHAKDLVRVCLLLNRVELSPAFPLQVSKEALRVRTDLS